MFRLLLVASILLPGIVLALRDRFMALLLYLWFAFFRPQDWIWFDISSLRLSLVLGIVLIVPSLATGIWPNLNHPLSIGMVIFLALGLVSQVGAVDQVIGWYWVDFFARLVVVCLLAVSLITTPKRLIRVMAVVAGSLGFFAAKAGLLSAIVGGVRFAEGLTGAFTDNNGYALGTVMIMPMLVAVGRNADLLFDGYWSWLNAWARRGFLLAVPLCGLTVISTFSRGGFLAMVAATATYVALDRRRVGLSLGLAVMLIIGVSVAPIPEGYLERLETIRTYQEVDETSAISRPYFWSVAVDMAEANPFGVGLRNFEAAYDTYDRSDGLYGSRRAVHSSHFQVLAELGFIGAFIWTVLFLLAFWLAVRARKLAKRPGLAPESETFLSTVPNCLIASMAGFLVGGSFLSAALNDLTWVTFALVAALDRLAPSLATGPSQAAAPTAAVLRSARTWRPHAAASGRARGPH
ncbi:MAG: O-antigen ligase family protein [Acidobacteriota bacterium]|nr:O-antigen ligase family protein [Acidobacteriota bacterium]